MLMGTDGFFNGQTQIRFDETRIARARFIKLKRIIVRVITRENTDKTKQRFNPSEENSAFSSYIISVHGIDPAFSSIQFSPRMPISDAHTHIE